MPGAATLDRVLAQWTRLGVGFGGAAVRATPDLERLLLETGRHARMHSRLFIMAATWLHRYGDAVAIHRLRHLAQVELGPDHQSVLGLLLDFAQRGTHPEQFAAVIRTLPPATEAMPLFEIEAESSVLVARAERRSCALGRRWNLWCHDFEFKFDALRPPNWVMARNPTLRHRIDFRGDLRASILAALEHDDSAGASEIALAQACGGSRAQVRNALANLELSCRAERSRTPGAKRTRIVAC
jgi:hypothetical protein